MLSCFVPEPLVFIDLETTGANFANDRIMEIGLVTVDQDDAQEWSSLVNPQAAIPAFITGLTGIDSSMVEHAPSFEQLAPLILEKLRGRLFIAHNARFDYNFLKREFKRLGINFRATNLCTVKLSRKLFPEHHRHSLDSPVSRFNITVSDRHRALADARVLWDLWQRWHDDLPRETFQNAVVALVGRPELPPQLDPHLIDDLPETPGAYAIYDQEGKLLLVKRSTNLRAQVLAHFAPEKRDSALARNTWRVEWRETAGEFGARLGELELSGHARKSFDGLCSWHLRKYGEGDFRPELVFAHDLDFASTADLFGLYMSRKEATQALRKIVEAHHLCFNQTGLGVDTSKHSKHGEACVGYRQKTCRGTCVGKESVSLHSARLMTALAKLRLGEWPFDGPVALIERDEFGMHEDFHLIDRWRYLGTVHDEKTLHDRLDCRTEDDFDPEIYRLINRFLKTGKIRVLQLAQGQESCAKGD